MDEVVALVDKTRPATVLLGAGASVSANIPLAAGIVEQALKKYSYLRNRLGDKPTYVACMASLLSGPRQDLIREVCEQAKINWAHIALAQLIKNRFVNRVLTTNFDPLIVRAGALVGTFPAVYDLAVTERFSSSLVAEQAVFHLHGQHAGMVQVHTEKDFDQVKARLKSAIEAADRGQTWIVIGYSGDNDPLVDVLAERHFEHGLYWVAYMDSAPSKIVEEKLLSKSEDVRLVTGYDADSFLVELATMKEVFPPDFVSRPFTSLRRTLDGLAAYSKRETGEDYTSETLKSVNAAIEAYEAKKEVDVARELADLTAGRTTPTQVTEAFEAASAQRRDQLAPIAASALFQEGNELYDRALAIADDAEVKALLAKAAAKYAEAHKLSPDLTAVLYNWAKVLFDQAERSQGDEAFRLYGEAGSKYELATRITPIFPDAYYNWGNALWSQALEREGNEAAALFDQAEAKYEESLKQQTNDGVLYNWGNMLVDRALGTSGATADKYYDEAVRKFARAVDLGPYASESRQAWGDALAAKARTKKGQAATALFEEAASKYLEADELHPGSATYERACMLLLAGRLDEGELLLRKCAESGILPPVAELDEDPDLDVVRQLDWFKQLRGRQAPTAVGRGTL